MIDAVRARHLCDMIADAEVIDLESALVRIPSFTYEERPLAEYIAAYMADLGLEVEMQTVPVADEIIGVQPIGTLRAGSGPTVLISGHMDYIGLDRPASWRFPPFEPTVDGGFIYGRGTKDEKGGICAMLIAAAALRRADVPLRGTIVFAPVMGHKTKVVGGGVGARALLSRVRADVAIVTENSDLGVATSSVGRVSGTIRLDGRPGWLGISGVDPLDGLCALQGALGPRHAQVPAGRWLRYEPDPEFPGFPSLSFTGVEWQPHQVAVTFALRIVQGQTDASVVEDLQSLAAAVQARTPGLTADLSVLAPSRLPYRTASDNPAVSALADAHRFVRGALPVIGAPPRLGAVADSYWFERAGIPTAVYGPGTLGRDFEDAPDERIAVRDLVDCAKVYAVALATLAQ